MPRASLGRGIPGTEGRPSHVEGASVDSQYPVFVNGTRVVPQPNSCLIYSWLASTFDILNLESLIFLNEIQRNLATREIIESVSARYPDESKDLIASDVDRLLAFLQERGYLELSSSPGANDEIFEFVDRMDEVKVVQADLEITKNCNLRCAYCFDEAAAGYPVLAVGKWIELFDSLHGAGLRVLKVSGGEPFTYPAILEFLEYAQEKFIVSINTNGHYVDERVAARLAGMHLQAVQVSLDSATSHVHDLFRGVGTWERAVRAIDLLHGQGVPLRISATATTRNVDGLQQLRDFAHARDAELSVEVLKPVGKAASMDATHFLADPQVVTQYSEKASAHKVLGEMAMTCQAQLGVVGISYKGNIKPCNLTEEFFDDRRADVVKSLDEDWRYDGSATLSASNAASERVVGLMASGAIESKDKCIFEY